MILPYGIRLRGKFIATFEDHVEAMIWFDEKATDADELVEDGEFTLELVDMQLGEVTQSYSSTELRNEHNELASFDEDRSKGKILYHELSPFERNLISDSLIAVAHDQEKSMTLRALQAFIAHHEGMIDDDLRNSLKETLSDPMRDIRARRNIAYFLRNRKVVVHTTVLIPDQGISS